jgi:hypothetical protein
MSRAPPQHVLLYNVKGVTYNDYLQVRARRRTLLAHTWDVHA